MKQKPGLRSQNRVGGALRETARHILAEARAAIEDRNRIEAVAVHDFRAIMKSWRAFLRLVEPFLDQEDRHWRTEAGDLARALAGARDAQAALDALDDAEKHTASHRLSSGSWESIRARLESLRQEAETAGLTPAMRSRIAASLDRADARVEQWPLDALTFADLARGLAHGYRRARGLIPKDWRAADADHVHELRKRVVVHRYQMDIVAPLWPRLGRCWVREAQKLRTRLGRHQDLAVLARLSEPHQPLARWRSRLHSVIAQRQAEQVAAAGRIAARLFAERPKAFRKRLEALWDSVEAAR
jgi:CHAD domain-containing protein